MSEPIYKIHGEERHRLKKELSFLKQFLKGFWHEHNMEKDMASFYGGYVMSDECAQNVFDENTKKVALLENMLNEPYKSLEDIRDEKIDIICQK